MELAVSRLFWFLTAKMLISSETSEIHLKVVPQLEKLYDVLVILSVWSFKNYLSIVYFTLLSQQEARANIHTPTHKKSCKYKKEYVMSDIDIEQSWRKYMNYVKLQKHPKREIDLYVRIKFTDLLTAIIYVKLTYL